MDGAWLAPHALAPAWRLDVARVRDRGRSPTRLIGHWLPPSGETQTLLAAALAACVLNLIAVVLLSRPLGAVLRRLRPDLPRVVARDYGGTVVVAGGRGRAARRGPCSSTRR